MVDILAQMDAARAKKSVPAPSVVAPQTTNPVRTPIGVTETPTETPTRLKAISLSEEQIHDFLVWVGKQDPTEFPDFASTINRLSWNGGYVLYKGLLGLLNLWKGGKRT